jgi:hypothetical protein
MPAMPKPAIISAQLIRDAAVSGDATVPTGDGATNVALYMVAASGAPAKVSPAANAASFSMFRTGDLPPPSVQLQIFPKRPAIPSLGTFGPIRGTQERQLVLR